MIGIVYAGNFSKKIQNGLQIQWDGYTVPKNNNNYDIGSPLFKKKKLTFSKKDHFWSKIIDFFKKMVAI